MSAESKEKGAPSDLPIEPMLSVEQVAAALNCSRDSARRFMDEMGVVKLGALVRVKRSAFEAWFAKKEKASCKSSSSAGTFGGVASRIRTAAARSASAPGAATAKRRKPQRETSNDKPSTRPIVPRTKPLSPSRATGS